MNTLSSRPSALSSAWPVLTQYEGVHLRRVALPLGGIGTGTVSLGGRGDLRDWEILNRPAKGFQPHQRHYGLADAAPFFALWTRKPSGETTTRVLEGQVPPEDYEGALGVDKVPNAGLPRFQNAKFAAAYPLGQVALSDEDVPVVARLEAFNPLIPGDSDASSWPVAVFRWVLKNTTDAPLEVAVCGTMTNFIGADQFENYQEMAQNRNEWRQSGTLSGIFGQSDDPEKQKVGNLAFGVYDEQESDISYRLDWGKNRWSVALLDFWDDFSADGRLDARTSDAKDPRMSLSVSATLASGEERAITFCLGWHFPRRFSWTTSGENHWSEENVVGNYYTTQFTDAWDVLEKFAAPRRDLEARTVSFVSAFCQSDLPAVVKEAALYNLSTLRTQTVFRLPSGQLFGWEGCADTCGSCFGSCTHVWNYETALGYTFGDLSRSMREVELLHATKENGLMCFRVTLPLQNAQNWPNAAADGQMGALMRFYRDWKLFGDEEWLQKTWPNAKKALEFAWLPGGWDADQDGVMEGCQHNTMDVEYYGPNPQMGFWYLGALKAFSKLAAHLGESDFAAKCDRLAQSGGAWMDAHLFNGHYYEHEIRPSGDAEVLTGLRFSQDDEKQRRDPDQQIGAGCLVDQLVGQYMAHVCDLGHLADPKNLKKTANSVYDFNRVSPMRGHFNHMRTFALGDESAVVMCSYPLGRRPQFPFPYYPEVMTGFEYAAACSLLQEGETKRGLQVISDIRERYDGRRRNPFDEAECGHHYARAMASWTALLTLTGFHYSAHQAEMKFTEAEKATWFWSNGSAFGTFSQGPDGFVLKVLEGEIGLKRLWIGEKCVARDGGVLKSGEEFVGA